MVSADDEQHDESGRPGAQSRDRGGSGFGPPVSGAPPSAGAFGPAVSEFGPPVAKFDGSAFGPPTGDLGPVGWKPVDTPGRPGLGWQPADASAPPPATVAPATPPVPSQYHTADSSSVREAMRNPAAGASRAPGAEKPPAPPAVRYPDQAPAAGERDSEQESWWRSAPSGFPPSPPRESPSPPRESSGSLWDDDELAEKLSVPRPTPAAPAEPRRNNRVIIGGAAAAIVVVVALVVLAVVFVTGKTPAPVPALSCPAHTEGNVTTGNGPGDTSSGTGAIFGFEHAYYSDRNGARARSFAAPDANLEAPEDLQKTIDQHVPPGTTYCLKITAMAADRFNAEITESRPNGSKAMYGQVMTTVNLDGRTLIRLIESY
jgi:hypothetical protein